MGGSGRAQSSSSCGREGCKRDRSEVGNAQSVVLLTDSTHFKKCGVLVTLPLDDAVQASYLLPEERALHASIGMVTSTRESKFAPCS